MKLSPAFIYVFLNVLDMFIVADVLIHLPLHEKQPELKTLKGQENIIDNVRIPDTGGANLQQS